MCKSIMIALGVTLKDKFTNDVRLSWAIVLRKLAVDMTVEEEVEEEPEKAKGDDTASEGNIRATSTDD